MMSNSHAVPAMRTVGLMVVAPQRRLSSGRSARCCRRPSAPRSTRPSPSAPMSAPSSAARSILKVLNRPRSARCAASPSPLCCGPRACSSSGGGEILYRFGVKKRQSFREGYSGRAHCRARRHLILPAGPWPAAVPEAARPSIVSAQKSGNHFVRATPSRRSGAESARAGCEIRRSERRWRRANANTPNSQRR